MLFEINHRTSYKYNKPVFFEPLTIRLKPVSNSFQQLNEFRIEIDPEPAGKTNILDFYGNESVVAWFNDTHTKLEISTFSNVRTSFENPYNFIITKPEAEKLPLDENSYDISIVKPYLQNVYENKELEKLVNLVLEKENHSTMGFITHFCSYIYNNFKQINRETGEPYSPDKTIKEAEGACRDLTVLMVEAMRMVNIPSRFISGYSYGTIDDTEEELHSWVEVYIPGGGWRGYDPNVGLAVDNTYIKVASGIIHYEASPVSGNFRGDEAEAEMDYSISIEKIG